MPGTARRDRGGNWQQQQQLRQQSAAAMLIQSTRRGSTAQSLPTFVFNGAAAGPTWTSHWSTASGHLCLCRPLPLKTFASAGPPPNRPLPPPGRPVPGSARCAQMTVETSLPPASAFSGGTKRATSENMPLLRLQSSEGKFTMPREIEPIRRPFCKHRSCTFKEVARLVPSGLFGCRLWRQPGFTRTTAEGTASECTLNAPCLPWFSGFHFVRLFLCVVSCPPWSRLRQLRPTCTCVTSSMRRSCVQMLHFYTHPVHDYSLSMRVACLRASACIQTAAGPRRSG